MFRRLLLACVVVAISFSAAAQRERSHDDPLGRELNYFRRAQPDRVALLTADGAGVEVTRVVIRRGSEVRSVSTQRGVEWRSENRVRLRSIPVLGQLFFDRFRQADIAPRNRIGTVYRDGDTLY